jgi:hypothetical protein
MEREVMKKSKQNLILICMYKKIYEPFFKTQIHGVACKYFLHPLLSC